MSATATQPEDRLVMTVEEAGQLLGISRGHAYEMARTGQLPTVRLGRRLIVVKSRLLEMLEPEPETPA